MKKIRWHYFDEEPNQCDGMKCHEEDNGLWYGLVYVGRTAFWVHACESCKEKADKLLPLVRKPKTTNKVGDARERK